MPQWQGPGTTGKPGRLAARGPSSPPQIQRQGPRKLHLRAEAAPATDWKQTGKPGIFEVHENSGHSSVIFGKSKTNTTPLTTLLLLCSMQSSKKYLGTAAQPVQSIKTFQVWCCLVTVHERPSPLISISDFLITWRQRHATKR